MSTTPPDPELTRFLEQDLYNELRWMLIAASEWQADIDCGKRWKGRPQNFDVLAMDSALLHARALYEFFLAKPASKSGAYVDQAYASLDFKVTITNTTMYDDWKDALNKRLFHLDLKRPDPEDKHGVPLPNKDVNTQIVAIAQDVLDLWDTFTTECSDYASLLTSRRSAAITEAAKAARSCGRQARVFT